MKLYTDFLIKLLTFLLDAITHKRNLSNVESIVQIYRIMKAVVNEEDDDPNPIHQFLILKAENGGKAIRPGSQLYLSLLYEDYRSPVGSSMRYQRVHIDGDLMTSLLDSMKNNTVKSLVGDLKDTSLLRMMCEVECSKYMELHYLYDKKECIYFALITTVTEGETFKRPTTRMNIETAVSKIRNLIKKAV